MSIKKSTQGLIFKLQLTQTYIKVKMRTKFSSILLTQWAIHLKYIEEKRGGKEKN